MVRHFAVVGDDPIMMLSGVIPATRKVLARAGLKMTDIDAFEVNEAFASVVLAWGKELAAATDYRPCARAVVWRMRLSSNESGESKR